MESVPRCQWWAVQVARLDVVIVDEREVPDPRAGEIRGQRMPESAAPDDERPRLQQVRETLPADLLEGPRAGEPRVPE